MLWCFRNEPDLQLQKANNHTAPEGKKKVNYRLLGNFEFLASLEVDSVMVQILYMILRIRSSSVGL